MCKTLILHYPCGHSTPAKGLSRCTRALDTNRPCQPQRKINIERGLCSDCTIASESARLDQSIRQARQNCERLGATKAQMASLEPSPQQLREWDRYQARESGKYYSDEKDSGYGSGSQYSGSSYRGSSSNSGYGSASQYSSSSSSSHRGGRQGSEYSYYSSSSSNAGSDRGRSSRR